jgi:DNA adenine methylase
MKPFLKWAGGKHRLAERILANLPKAERLIEPFAGSGAVFLNSQFDSYLLADSNADLISLYHHVQEFGHAFAQFAATFFSPENNTAGRFYALRAEFNESTDRAKKAALFIYLNRHCFNGLCRYNAKGQFNVPFGRYRQPAFPAEELMNFHRKSQSAVFVVADFRSTMAQATPACAVYCDPPYAPLTATANFSDYTGTRFGLAEQLALADCARALMQRGIPVLISNHDTEFTRAMYSDAKIISFSVQRFISGKTGNRNKAAECLATYA